MANEPDRRDRSAHPVTMRDVARVAGVSVATVSHVVNDKAGARLGAAARERVRQEIDELGYRPNRLAKNRVRGRSRFIGLVADAIATTPFAGQIIQGAQKEAWKHGFVLLVANTEGDREAEDEAIAMMLEHQVRGILYSTWYHRAVDTPAALGETTAVLVDCYSPDGQFPAIVPDEVGGGRTATELLLAAGHRRIAFVNAAEPSPAQEGRLRGYREALADAGIAFDDELVLAVHDEQDGGYEAGRTVLQRGATAVFCYNDRIAMGLYDRLREQGVSIPGELAVVGFDNQEIIAAHLRPPLSTVALPHYELGAAGVRVLLGLEEVPDGEPLLVACPPVSRQSV